MPRQSVLAGHIAPIIESFILSKDELHNAIEHVSAILSVVDIGVLCAFGWLLLPSLQIIHSFITSFSKESKQVKEKKDNGTEEKFVENEFKSSYLCLAACQLSQLARWSLLVYACDCVVAALGALGYKAEVASTICAKIIYTSWFARRAQRLKHHLIRKLLNKASENCDKIMLIDRITDGMIYALLGVKLLDYLSMETGYALTSIFAVGTTGGLIISLASQEIAKGIMNGVEMAASDRFYEKDNVHFGDGTKGYIMKMGFLRTKIRNYDSTIIDIPNSQLGGQRAINISRSKICRVLTKLRFEYQDVQKIPLTMISVKEEIAKACPKLINDGRKPFRAMISSFERDCVEVTINCSFDLPPTGADFWANRHEMFLAIDRGVSNSEIQYAKPTFHLQDQS